MAQGTYQQSGPSAPQTARAVLFVAPPQQRGFAPAPAQLVIGPLLYQARAAGVAGESVTVTHVASGASTPLSIAVVSNAITVTLATNAAGASVTEADAVRDLVNTTPAASALVSVVIGPGARGDEVVPAAASAPLAGDSAVVTTGTESNAPFPSMHPQQNSYATR